ncbi:N-terminal Xaa-Pro-Lys N-methyltransferase 1-B [Acropora cervicornis]|uniref:Alpha N-terminal protein methyltransferase 1 n=1 Tax=Acropora cervicornis TaxID=6130 RepID=A0AAD9PRI9_ACRCE|nr:N-terminal Xaa-Pro-Lys N-methyltransferase 1-B [Acropora cervicornis]
MACTDDDAPAEMEDKSSWYGQAADYWKNIPATVNGMLGGYASISMTDVTHSKRFLTKFLKLTDKLEEKPPKQQRIDPTDALNDCSSFKIKPYVALDCGAGIGRVTKNLLLPLFDTVDLVEQNPDFVEKAKEYIQFIEERASKKEERKKNTNNNFVGIVKFQGEKSDRVGHFYCKGLQDFEPEHGRYNVIWCQWVLGHLTDGDFVDFFTRCQKGLSPNGLIFVKENITKTGVDLDSQDNSVTRSDKKLKDLFAKSHLTVLEEEVQKNFPKELYRVKMMVHGV